MRKRLLTLFLAVALVFTATIPAWACTPSLDLDIWGDLTPPNEIEYTPSEDVDKACDNAARKWLEEHPIDIPATTETDTEVETEVESEVVTESEAKTTTQKYHVAWKKYIPESLRARWYSFIRK